MIWNALKTAVRLKLGLANPYQIKPQYCQLSTDQKSLTSKFMQKKQINKNTHLLRLALPDANKCLGLMIGQYVNLQVNNKKRPYNPISPIDEAGHVDFLIRDLIKQNGKQSFTSNLLGLKEGDPVEIQGPFTQYIYRGYGQIEWENNPLKTYKHIGIIAFQSGITGAYTLIDSLMPSYDNRTGLSLLWIGQQMDDFIFIDEFSMLAEQYRLNCNLMLRDLKQDWIGPYGKITARHIQSFMPPPGPDTMLLLVGGPSDMEHLSPILKQLKYQHVMYPKQS